MSQEGNDVESKTEVSGETKEPEKVADAKVAEEVAATAEAKDKPTVVDTKEDDKDTPAKTTTESSEKKKVDDSDLFGDDSDSDSDDSDKKETKKKPVSSSSSSSSSSSDSSDDEQPVQRKKRRLTKMKESKKKKAKKPVKLKSKGDDFIASDDDNMDLRKEYEAQKEFESDEDPYPDQEKKESESEGDDFDKALRRLKNRNKRKGDGMSEQDREAFVHDFLVKMDKAAEDDITARSQKKLAVHKLNLLKEVMENLAKRSLQSIFLERNLLQVLGQWLRPSPIDSALPNLTIRNQIIDILPQLNIEADHLRRGRFGKVVNYLKDCPKETPENRKKLAKLIQRWARSIYGKADSFKNLSQAEQERMAVRAAAERQQRKVVKKAAPVLNNLRKVKGNAVTRIGEANKKADTTVQYRARIPAQRDFNFSRARANMEMPKEQIASREPKKNARKIRLERKLRLVGKRK